jgi:hypothetical protein
MTIDIAAGCGRDREKERGEDKYFSADSWLASRGASERGLTIHGSGQTMFPSRLAQGSQGSRESLDSPSVGSPITTPSRRQGSDGSFGKSSGRDLQRLGALSPTRDRVGSGLRLSRPSSREQILNEFSKNSSGTKQSDVRASFQAVNKARGLASTTVQFNVSVTTQLGDRVVVVGNCTPLGMWESRNGLELDTNPSLYPLWRGEAAVPSGDAVEYKYVIIGADGDMRWEDDIENRMFTPEGTRTVLEDGNFNVETARLLNESKQSVEKKVKRGVKHFTEMPMEIEADDTLYVLSYRLPLACSRDEASGQFQFEWLTMLSDSKTRQGGDSKVMRSMSRHATYVIESLRQLRPRCNVWFVGGLGVRVAQEEREHVTETLARDFQVSSEGRFCSRVHVHVKESFCICESASMHTCISQRRARHRV